MRTLFIVLVLALITPADAAQGVARGQGAEWNPDQQALLETLAKKYEIEQSKLRSFRDEPLGWGEIIIGLEMAKVAEAAVGEVLGKRQTGSKWEEIAASYQIELKDVIREQDALEVVSEENRPISELMAEAYGFSEERLVTWKGDDLAWAELQIAIAAAKKAKKSVEEILEFYRSGAGWGEIAKSNGFRPGDIMSEAGNPLKKMAEKDE